MQRLWIALRRRFGSYRLSLIFIQVFESCFAAAVAAVAAVAAAVASIWLIGQISKCSDASDFPLGLI